MAKAKKTNWFLIGAIAVIVIIAFVLYQRGEVGAGRAFTRPLAKLEQQVAATTATTVQQEQTQNSKIAALESAFLNTKTAIAMIDSKTNEISALTNAYGLIATKADSTATDILEVLMMPGGYDGTLVGCECLCAEEVDDPGSITGKRTTAAAAKIDCTTACTDDQSCQTTCQAFCGQKGIPNKSWSCKSNVCKTRG